ncbi:hypothetical protein T08_4082 [Trichinella sp. T8]|nr:hypothetical protein T08_4082 [Trichinella sp. T8]
MFIPSVNNLTRQKSFASWKHECPEVLNQTLADQAECEPKRKRFRISEIRDPTRRQIEN